MPGGTNFFHLEQHLVKAQIFLVLEYNFLLNFDKVVPEMKKVTTSCNFCHEVF